MNERCVHIKRDSISVPMPYNNFLLTRTYGPQTNQRLAFGIDFEMFIVNLLFNKSSWKDTTQQMSVPKGSQRRRK